jgi:thiol:disulfide interchange protein
MIVFNKGLGLSLMAGLFLGAGGGQSAAAPKEGEITIVKYTELGELVKKHRGKVVVVDLWATW